MYMDIHEIRGATMEDVAKAHSADVETQRKYGDAILRDALGALGGREVKHTGDGIMACFVSAVAAARCATRIQGALAQHERENREIPVKVRIGAEAGEPVENHLDLFGSTVQLAARLCSHAQPEQRFHSRASIARSEYTPYNSPAKRRQRRSNAPNWRKSSVSARAVSAPR